VVRKVGMRYGGLWCISGLLLVAGCQQPPSTIKSRRPASIEPFAGKSPRPVSPLAERPRSAQPRPQSGGEGGWIPARGISDRWECIVIHHAASDNATPQGMADYHVRVRGWDALGYHFVIGNGVNYEDGRVFVGERWHKQMHGAHCKTPGNYHNNHGIGICLIGNFEEHAPTLKQLESLSRLVSFLNDKCDIPESKVLTHGGVTHKTACPGRFFSLSEIRRRLAGLSASAVEFWHNMEPVSGHD